MSDLRHAARSLIRTPGFTLVAVLVLALGIGANTAIFSVVDAVLLTPMPYPEAERLVRLSGPHPQMFAWFNSRGFESWPELQNTRSFSDVGGYLTGGVNLGGKAGRRLRAAAVTPEFFAVLSAKAIVGRAFNTDDVSRSRHVAVISHRLWQSAFAGDPGILERSIILNGESFLVLGIMPPRVDMPEAAEVWIPNSWDRIGDSVPKPILIARLQPGVSLAEARVELLAIARNSRGGWRRSVDDPGEALSYRLTPLRDALVVDTKPVILVVAAGALLVLFVACINTANLLLTRVSARRREYAVRRALGASNADLARQILCESLMLSLSAGAVTLPIALWALDAIRALVPLAAYGASEITLNDRAIIATAGFSLLTAAFFSIAPLWALRSEGPSEALRAGSAATPDPAWRRFRSALVIAEVAVSLVLLAGAVTVLRTVASLMAVDLGARGEGALVIQLDLPGEQYTRYERVWQYYERLDSAIRALPGVREVAVTSALPGSANQRTGMGELLIDGEPTPPGAKYVGNHITTTPDYFSALGIGLVAGRAFATSDGFFAPKVAIVSESFVRNYGLLPATIVGRTAILDQRRVEIVGVVKDVRLGGPEADFVSAVYVPLAQRLGVTQPMSVVLRAGGDPRALVPAIRAAAARVDPSVPLYNVQTFDEIRATFVRDRRFVMTMMSAFGGLAFALAALGLYGVIGYLVQLRTKEIGVRMALGASRSSVRLQVLTTGLSHACGGIAVGCAVALAVPQFFSASFATLGQLQLSSLGFISVAIAGVAAVATWFPARRATLIDPVQALRFE